MTSQPVDLGPGEEGGPAVRRSEIDAGPATVRRRRTSLESPSAEPATARQPVIVEDVVVPRRVLGYRRRPRFEARKVRRLIRHVDPWSVLKLSVLLAVSGWLVVMIASTILWQVATAAGTVESIEKFVNSSFELENWSLDGSFLFRQVGLISLIGAFSLAGSVVVATLVFNLISDIIGGVWITVVEEESARPIGTAGGAEASGSPEVG